MWRFFLNLILPPAPRVAELEAMSAADFRASVPPLPFQPQERILALFPYSNPLVKTAVWEIKYRGNQAIARLMGTLLAEELTEWLAELSETENFRAPLLVPLPLSRKRERERGFNQCELIANEMRPMLGGAVELRTEVLKKIKETGSQTKSRNRGSRFKNLEGCFAVKNHSDIKKRNIILLDDVTTTGATLSEARKTLLAFGARKVIALVFAH